MFLDPYPVMALSDSEGGVSLWTVRPQDNLMLVCWGGGGGGGLWRAGGGCRVWLVLSAGRYPWCPKSLLPSASIGDVLDGWATQGGVGEAWVGLLEILGGLVMVWAGLVSRHTSYL